MPIFPQWRTALFGLAFLGRVVGLGCVVGSSCGLGTAPRVRADETFQWSTSLGTASLGTGQHEKPLLIVDLAGDVTAEPFTSRLGRLLEATTFRDPRVIKLSQQRFKVVCRQHGPTPVLQRHLPKGQRKSSDSSRADNVVFYFCTPDARVLHMATGFLPPAELLAAANRAERLLRESQLLSDAGSRRQAVRDLHFTCVDGNHLAEFRRRLGDGGERRNDTADGDRDYVLRVIEAASEVQRRELRMRYGDQWQGTELEQMIATLSHHGEVATSFPHLVLGALPLVQLDLLDQPCFETVTGQPCLSIGSRRKAIHGWYVTARRQRQPILIVVDDRPFAAPLVNELSDLVIWQPRSREVRRRLENFAAIQVTPGELAGLIHDAGLAPVTLSRSPLNWLLYDRDGKFVEALVSEHGRRLPEVMDVAAR